MRFGMRLVHADIARQGLRGTLSLTSPSVEQALIGYRDVSNVDEVEALAGLASTYCRAAWRCPVSRLA